MQLQRQVSRILVLATVGLWCSVANAGVGPFYEAFENTSADDSYLVDAGWVIDSTSGPPAGRTQFRPTFGENVSDRRNYARNGEMPGYLDLTQRSATDRVGGDYATTAYPIGFLGDYWFGSADRRYSPDQAWNDNGGPDVALDGLSIRLQSRAFLISGNVNTRRYLSFLVGGYRAPGAAVQVSLKYRPAEFVNGSWQCPGPDLPGTATWLPLPRVDIYHPNDEFDASSLVQRLQNRTQINHASVPAIWQVDDSSVLRRGEQMQLVVMDLWRSSRNPIQSAMCARVEVLDSDPLGHVNVDEILMSDVNEVAARYPRVPYASFGRPRVVHGYADLHTHWMNHLAFGAEPLLSRIPGVGTTLKGLATTMGVLWGSPYFPNSVLAGEICGDGAATCPAAQTANCSSAFPYPCSLSADRQRQLALPLCERSRHEARWPLAHFRDGTAHSNPASSNGPGRLALNAGYVLGGDAAGCGATCSHFSHGYNPVTQRYQLPARPFADPAHQQMYWEWVRRAYDGGLRLLVTDVGQSAALEAVMNDWWWLRNQLGSGVLYGHATDDWYAIRRQACAVKKVVALAPEIAEFAQIAYTPAEAREIIRSGRMAIVLGVEVDSLGSLRPNQFGGNPTLELAALQSVGIRKITPVHVVDNRLGGAAVYDGNLVAATDALNLNGGMMEGVNAITVDNLPSRTNPNVDAAWRLNQYLFDRGTYGGAHALTDLENDRVAHLANGQIILTGAYNRFLDASGETCGDPSPVRPSCWTASNFFQAEMVDTPCMRGGDCVNQSFSQTWIQKRPAAVWDIFIQTQHKTAPMPFPSPPPTDPRQVYWNVPGVHRNYRGLAVDGSAYLAEATRRALLIDLDHMSEKAREQLLAGEPIWTAGCDHPNQGSAACQRSAYPVIATHASVREAGGRTWDKGIKTERSLDTADLQTLLRTGGTIGIGAGYQSIDTPPVPRSSSLIYINDCPGSSKALGAHYLWYLNKGETSGAFDTFGMPLPPAWLARGVSIGSDSNGFAPELGARYNTTNGVDGGDSARCDEFGSFGLNQDANQTTRAGLQSLRPNGVYYGDSPIPFEALESVMPMGSAPAQPPLSKLFFAAGSGTDVSVGGTCVDGNGTPYGCLFGPDSGEYRGFDFNYTGVANIGLEPDLLQDMVNPTRTTLENFREMQYQMRNLFHGVESFLQTWEKAEAICLERTGNSPTCTPAPPSDAETCDMWVSDVDTSPTNQTGGTDSTPSCMNRCGQTLYYYDAQQVLRSCDCFYDSAVQNDARFCADFKPWCKYASHVEYNCSSGCGQ